MKDNENGIPLPSTSSGSLGHWTSRRAGRSRLLFFLIPSFLSLSTPGADSIKPKKASPTAWLDGLRGIAALAVFVFHFSFRTFGTTLAYGQKDSEDDNNLHWLRLPFIRLLYSGAPWVSIFFIISGYVLSVRPLRQIRAKQFEVFTRSMGSSILRRPIRLYFPCVLSSFLVFTMIRLGIYDATRPVADNLTYFPVQPHETHEVRLESLYAQLTHWYKTVSELIHNGFNDNFFGANFSYDVHLWTIPNEMRSSFFIFLALMLVSRMQTRTRTFTFLFLIWWSMDGGRWEMVLFYAGAMLAEQDLIKAASPDPSTPPFLHGMSREALRAVYIVSTIMGLYFCSFPEEKADTTPGFVVLDYLVPAPFVQRFRFWHGVGAIQLVWTMSNWQPLQRLFAAPVVQYFGRISYGVYLMHGPVIHSFGYAVLPFFWNWGGGQLGFAACGVVTLAVVIWAGDVFERVGDMPCVRFGRWLAVKVGVEEERAVG